MSKLARSGSRRNVVAYVTASGNSPPEEFFEEVEKKAPKTATGIRSLIQKLANGEPLTGDMYSKMEGTDDLSRIRRGDARFLCFSDGHELVIAHGFWKETNETPRHHIGTAERRQKDYFERKRRQKR